MMLAPARLRQCWRISGAAPYGRAETKKAKKERRFRPNWLMLEMLRSVFGSDGDFEKLGLDQVFDGNLEGSRSHPKHRAAGPKTLLRSWTRRGGAARCRRR